MEGTPLSDQAASARDAIVLGVESGDWTGIEKWLSEYSMFTFNNVASAEKFPEDVLEIVLGLLGLPDVASAQGASHCLQVVQSDFSSIPVESRDALLDTLERAYPLFSDPLACFIASEIVGEYLVDNARALPIIKRWAALAGTHRAYAVFGLGLIARHSENPAIKVEARTLLGSFMHDENDDVRVEAAAGLARLSTG